jgi:hypothetical protein
MLGMTEVCPFGSSAEKRGRRAAVTTATGPLTFATLAMAARTTRRPSADVVADEAKRCPRAPVSSGSKSAKATRVRGTRGTAKLIALRPGTKSMTVVCRSVIHWKLRCVDRW